MKQLDLNELKRLQDEKREKERRQDNKQHATKILRDMLKRSR